MKTDIGKENERLYTSQDFYEESKSKSRICQRFRHALRFFLIAILVCSIFCLVAILVLMKTKLDTISKQYEEIRSLNNSGQPLKKLINSTGIEEEPKAQKLAALAGILAKGGAGVLAKGGAGVLARGGASALANAGGTSGFAKGGVGGLARKTKDTLSSVVSSRRSQRGRATSRINNGEATEISSAVHQGNRNTALEYLRERKKASQNERMSSEAQTLANEEYRHLHLEVGYDKEIKLSCEGKEPSNTFPNIDYALMGYDIYKGFPLSNGHDPGFTYPIFQADYTSGLQTDDCRFNIPRDVVAVTDISCVTSFSMKVFKNIYELENGVNVYANTHVDLGFQFRANSEFRSAWTMLATGENVYVLASAQCSYYLSKIKTDKPPAFEPYFLQWIQKLNNSQTNDTYQEFLSIFGTHFVKEATFGARFSYQSTKTKHELETQKLNGTNMEVNGGYGNLFSFGAGLGSESFFAAKGSSFSKSSQIISIGIAPPSSGSGEAWASKVQENPMPLAYKVEPIETLLQPELFEGLDLDLSSISQKVAEIRLTEYYNRLILDSEREEYFASGRWITKTLTVENGGKEGQWYPPEFCPLGYFAVGYKMKIDFVKGNADNTALNAVNLMCASKSRHFISGHLGIQSGVGHRGLWTANALCPKTTNDLQKLFIHKFTQYRQKSENGRENADELSVNFIQVECNDMTRHLDSIPLIITVPHLGYSHYGSKSESCPQGSAVCGIQTRVDAFQKNKDNTGLNDIKLICCDDDMT